jgi:hypothetical protein
MWPHLFVIIIIIIISNKMVLLLQLEVVYYRPVSQLFSSEIFSDIILLYT